MSDLSPAVGAEIEATISRLVHKAFKPDPIAGPKYSKIVSVVSSAYKRHGNIIHLAILEELKQQSHLVAWDDPSFHVSAAADSLVGTSIGSPTNLIGSNILYEKNGPRTLQVDAIVFNRSNATVTAYEIKRGFGMHDAGKKRSMLRDTLCTQVLLKSYAEQRGFTVSAAFSHVIFYYGACSLSKPFALCSDDLDEHFGFELVAHVERVNDRFRARLHEVLEDS